MTQMGETVSLANGCPDWRSQYFSPGPHGAAARYIRCCMCGAKFWWCPPFTPYRIDNEDHFYSLNMALPLDML